MTRKVSFSKEIRASAGPSKKIYPIYILTLFHCNESWFLTQQNRYYMKAKYLMLVMLFQFLLAPDALFANWYSWESRTNQTYNELIEFSNEMIQRGFVPINIQGCNVFGEAKYTSIWQLPVETTQWSMSVGLTASQYQAEFDTKKNDYTPADIHAYTVDNEARFAIIWHKNTNVTWQTWSALNGSELSKMMKELDTKGYAIVDVNGYTVNGQIYYSALWKVLPQKWEMVFGVSQAEYQATFDKLTPKGYVPVDLDVFNNGQGNVFSAIWMYDKTQTWAARHDFNSVLFKSFAEEYSEKGYALVDASLYLIDGEQYYSFLYKRNQGKILPKYQNPKPTPDIGAGNSSAVKKILSVNPVQQQTNVWCWLAVGEMIMKHMGMSNANPSGNYQCGIIGTIAPIGSPCRGDCFNPVCIVPSGSNYNTIKMLRDYSWAMGKKALMYQEGNELPFTAIKNNIDNNKPILCGVSYSKRNYYGGAEHAVVMVGYEQTQSNVYVIINDPFSYPSGNNPYLNEGGSILKPYQYKISLKNFTQGVFWHWSVYNIGFGV
jgi:hypothetical protein